MLAHLADQPERSLVLALRGAQEGRRVPDPCGPEFDRIPDRLEELADRRLNCLDGCTFVGVYEGLPEALLQSGFDVGAGALDRLVDAVDLVRAVAERSVHHRLVDQPMDSAHIGL